MDPRLEQATERAEQAAQKTADWKKGQAAAEERGETRGTYYADHIGTAQLAEAKAAAELREIKGKLALDLTDLTAAEIDAELFEAMETAQRTEQYLATRLKQADKALKLNGEIPEWLTEQIAADEAKLDKWTAAGDKYEAEYARRGGWQRYLLVGGGHLHYGNCFTLTPGRTYASLIAEASGLDADQVVGKFGTTACTHCFADAPVAGDADKLKAAREAGYCERFGDKGYLTGEEMDWMDKADPSWARKYHVYARCSTCGNWPSVTTTNKFRKHKAAE